MTNKVGKIYKILFKDKENNLLSDKIYIGKTIRDLNTRLYEHAAKKNNKIIGQAIRKYGRENTYIELVEDNIPIEILDDIELKYIAKFNSLVPNGYNCQENKMPNPGYNKTSIQKGLDTKARRKIDPEYYDKCHPKGRKHTDEAKKKISENHHSRIETIEERDLRINKGKQTKKENPQRVLDGIEKVKLTKIENAKINPNYNKHNLGKKMDPKVVAKAQATKKQNIADNIAKDPHYYDEIKKDKIEKSINARRLKAIYNNLCKCFIIEQFYYVLNVSKSYINNRIQNRKKGARTQ